MTDTRQKIAAATLSGEPELSGRSEAGLPTSLLEVGVRVCVGTAVTRNVVATALEPMIVVATTSAGGAIAIGVTATGVAVSWVGVRLSMWGTEHNITVRYPNAVIIAVGSTVGAPTVGWAGCRNAAGRDTISVVITLGVVAAVAGNAAATVLEPLIVIASISAGVAIAIGATATELAVSWVGV